MLGSKRRRHLTEAGFTLVEMTISVAVMGIIALGFLGITANYFVVINRNNELSTMTVNSQNLLRTTVENIRFGDGVRQTNQLSDSHAPVGGWNTNNSIFVIVIAVPAVDRNHQYIIDPSTGSPYMNELVYYRDGSTLMERKLANPAATGNTLYTTCPQASASASCTADPVLAEDVNSMTFTLYDQDGATTGTAADARSVKIDLTMERDALTRPITVKNSIQVTLRNRF